MDRKKVEEIHIVRESGTGTLAHHIQSKEKDYKLPCHLYKFFGNHEFIWSINVF